MNNGELSKTMYNSIIHEFVQVFKMFWAIDEFKSAIIGIPVSVITFWIVGIIFRHGRRNGIWFGRRGGKLLYYLVNTFLVWIVMKIV